MRCICCNNKVNLLEDIEDGKTHEDVIYESKEYNHGGKKTITHAGSRMWDDGLVDRVSAGYGSCHDGSLFIIAICDKCLTDKKECGVIAYVGDYMSPYSDFTKMEVDENKIIFRRNNNLEDLTD